MEIGKFDTGGGEENSSSMRHPTIGFISAWLYLYSALFYTQVQGAFAVFVLGVGKVRASSFSKSYVL